MNPIVGDIVPCEECGAPYKYFRWTLGNTRRYCRPCLDRHQELNIDDPIDLNKEQDMIMTEAHEQNKPKRR